MTAAADMTVGELHGLIARSECYRDFPRERLEAALKVLSGFYPFARPLIDWDRETDTLRKRANTAMASVTGAGTIPSSSAYPVHHADSRVHLGELDEEYITESRVGDVFQLGTCSWMISRIENDRVYVQEAPNRFSEIPFWRAEARAAAAWRWAFGWASFFGRSWPMPLAAGRSCHRATTSVGQGARGCG